MDSQVDKAMRCGQDVLIRDQRSTANVEVLLFLQNIGLKEEKIEIRC